MKTNTFFEDRHLYEQLLEYCEEPIIEDEEDGDFIDFNEFSIDADDSEVYYQNKLHF